MYWLWNFAVYTVSCLIHWKLQGSCFGFEALGLQCTGYGIHGCRVFGLSVRFFIGVLVFGVGGWSLKLLSGFGSKGLGVKL